MEPNEIAYVDPALMLVDPEVITIPVGLIAVIPHVEYEDAVEDDQEQMEKLGTNRIPEFTILLGGQKLKRENYPELSPLMPDGGFYDFEVPDLIGKFIIGINATTNEIIRGDGVMYYQSIPAPVKEQRDVRD